MTAYLLTLGGVLTLLAVAVAAPAHGLPDPSAARLRRAYRAIPDAALATLPEPATSAATPYAAADPNNDHPEVSDAAYEALRAAQTVRGRDVHTAQTGYLAYMDWRNTHETDTNAPIGTPEQRRIWALTRAGDLNS